ncbi:hypothetical protein CcaverHIS002_0402310 [Cutaneotrichosporon cavernicola]|uniref:Uncharacterized protein n=1 Tax=Cutaneotrichosporon cavernicola TaxID=279322 RepID=A0AA48L3S6_9TREE|nr:uncharacterized protein CcaverHIS019_0402280 [Cutaneotrichosporon cavernicola]BEI83627.1 hypothetical protein CcaverHIS002_0402310 [Cutaneotrichosporon cavernicola]BEI91408.1 hypothetical protein CcaverHIS019_0402280 [Cutaneotrichosporon cavernicola]BEI99181.1 hypothetical protein CcaverHIS631_0402240 [Cutaneotrichosporon cavernicola]BEJ06957.1 hypothetical protein CcaverHIS641_0402260 [Cutaneotrichosporon cavernicola]
MLVSLFLAASSVAAQANVFAGGPVNDIRVSVDHVVQCEQATISWTGNSGAVDVQIGLGGYYVGTNWIAEIAAQTGSSTSWTVNQAAGAGTLIFQVTDTTGAFNYVQNIAIQSSDKSSCLTGDGSQAATTSAQISKSSESPESGSSSSDTNPPADSPTQSAGDQAPGTDQNSPSSNQAADATSTLTVDSSPARAESPLAASASVAAVSVARPAANASPSISSAGSGAQHVSVAAGVIIVGAALVATL